MKTTVIILSIVVIVLTLSVIDPGRAEATICNPTLNDFISTSKIENRFSYFINAALRSKVSMKWKKKNSLVIIQKFYNKRHLTMQKISCVINHDCCAILDIYSTIDFFCLIINNV